MCKACILHLHTKFCTVDLHFSWIKNHSSCSKQCSCRQIVKVLNFTTVLKCDPTCRLNFSIQSRVSCFVKMDVSIAVTLIRGQMGAVVERAVNGAVETVLSEMLKVVGVKFEELKAQVALMKRDMAALQREKALKEKENENIRAKLRYTELKLKYYRQGVEEELQQRLSASALVRIDPATFHQAQRGGVGVSSAENTPVGSSQSWNSEGAQSKRSQGNKQHFYWLHPLSSFQFVALPSVLLHPECTSPQRHAGVASSVWIKFVLCLSNKYIEVYCTKLKNRNFR